MIKFDVKNAERNFAIGLDGMAKLTGFDRRGILRAEAATILKTCAARTQVAKLSEIQIGAQKNALVNLGLTGRPSGELGNVTINTGQKAPFGRVFARRVPGAGFVRTHNEGFQFIAFSPTGRRRQRTQELEALIAKAKAKVATVAEAARKSAGLARQSWVLIADSLGITLETTPGGQISANAIAKARNAQAKAQKQRFNGIGTEESGPNGAVITLTNRLPYGRRIGLDRLLQTVIAGRASFFANAVAKGFDGSLEQTARLFKGWTVRRSVN